jgi:hypothetical protein
MQNQNQFKKIGVVIAMQFLLMAPNVFAQKEKQNSQLEWHTDLMKVRLVWLVHKTSKQRIRQRRIY